MFFSQHQPPPKIVYTTIPPRDYSKPPQVMPPYTEEMLRQELTIDMLANVTDPAMLLNERVKYNFHPTIAGWTDNITGRRTLLNPVYLATREQADYIKSKLERLGLLGAQIQEDNLSNPFSTFSYEDETRRVYSIDGFNVGLLYERYLKYPIETADQMTLAELKAKYG